MKATLLFCLLVLAACGDKTIASPSDGCLCHSSCASLPSEATPDALGEVPGYLCNAPECPANHACVVTAWSPREQLYYGRCEMTCEPGECVPAEKENLGTVGCVVSYPYRETAHAGVCEPVAFDFCVARDVTYDCQTRDMDYIVSCDDTVPKDKEHHVHLGSD